MSAYILTALIGILAVIFIAYIHSTNNKDSLFNKSIEGKNEDYVNMVKYYQRLPKNKLSTDNSIQLVYDVLHLTGNLRKNWSCINVNIVESLAEIRPVIYIGDKNKYCGTFSTILSTDGKYYFYKDIGVLANKIQPEYDFLTHPDMLKWFRHIPNFSFSKDESVDRKIERHIMYYNHIKDVNVKDQIASVINMLIRTSDSRVKPYSFLTVWPDGVDPTTLSKSVYSKYLD